MLTLLPKGALWNEHKISLTGGQYLWDTNAVLFNEVLWRGLYTLGCEVNKKGIYTAKSSIKIMKKLFILKSFVLYKQEYDRKIRLTF